MRYHLHVPAPAAPLHDCLCALWGPTRGPAIVGLHGSPPTGEVGPCGIEATGAAWLRIADAIDSGATLALPTVAIGPLTTDPRSRKESRTILGEDAVRHLSPDDLSALAADICAKLTPAATGAPFTPLAGMRAKCNRCGEEMPADDRGRHVCPRLNPDVIASAPRPTPHHGAVPVMSTVCVHGLDFGAPCLPCREYIRGIKEGRQEAEAAPRPVADQTPTACPICDRDGTDCPTLATLIRSTVTNSEARRIALAAAADCHAHRHDWRAEALAWRAKATTPPAIPDDLRALLEALVAADEAHERAAAGRRMPGHASESPVDTLEALWSRTASVIAWTRAHAGGGR